MDRYLPRAESEASIQAMIFGREAISAAVMPPKAEPTFAMALRAPNLAIAAPLACARSPRARTDLPSVFRFSQVKPADCAAA
jgi:hypothetical protein